MAGRGGGGDTLPLESGEQGALTEGVVNDEGSNAPAPSEMGGAEGFRTYKSTHTAITTTCETIANALAEKKVYMVLRDVAKAFDKVWHNGLKYKLLKLELPSILEKKYATF